jgi:hypothetical protein
MTLVLFLFLFSATWRIKEDGGTGSPRACPPKHHSRKQSPSTFLFYSEKRFMLAMAQTDDQILVC